jgi:hypothetical protein
VETADCSCSRLDSRTQAALQWLRIRGTLAQGGVGFAPREDGRSKEDRPARVPMAGGALARSGRRRTVADVHLGDVEVLVASAWSSGIRPRRNIIGTRLGGRREGPPATRCGRRQAASVRFGIADPMVTSGCTGGVLVWHKEEATLARLDRRACKAVVICR